MYQSLTEPAFCSTFAEYFAIRDDLRSRYSLSFLPSDVEWTELRGDLNIMTRRGRPVEIVLLARFRHITVDEISDDQGGDGARATGSTVLRALKDANFDDGSVLCKMTKE